jgi:hypothetical protein
MRFDRKKVFDGLRARFASKGLDKTQVEIIGALLDEFERRELPDPRFLAYMLATAWGECQWRPVREIGRGKGKDYGKPVNGKRVYYGRGLVQLTWLENYEKLGRALNIPLAENPDLALVPVIAVDILFVGMLDGMFAKDKKGKPHSLARYFGEGVDDPIGARRIINGTDKAEAFARWHRLILEVLEAARMPADEIKPSADVPIDPPAGKNEPAAIDVEVPAPPPAGKAAAGGIAGGVAAGAAAAASGFPWAYVLLGAGVIAAILFISIIIAKGQKNG